jgi:hypothetical protein
MTDYRIVGLVNRKDRQSSLILGNRPNRILFANRPRRFFNEARQTHADTVRYTKYRFQSGIAKPTFDQTQHGFRNPRTLTDSIIRQFSLFPLLSQESYDLFANRFMIFNARHTEVSQESRLDTYFAIVKYRCHAQRITNCVQSASPNRLSPARTKGGSNRANASRMPPRNGEDQAEHPAKIDDSSPGRRDILKMKSLSIRCFKNVTILSSTSGRLGMISRLVSEQSKDVREDKNIFTNFIGFLKELVFSSVSVTGDCVGTLSER